ncbi:kinase-like protein [Calocera cornea HHB12733]|uniref:Kinase-like protein n=1 Tax=Calocera cornea HHB12733 TaxID=1353952 RepID=A0A165HQX0_9BASI|nr:kinase-like protein [Calocera cornea HHB12733]
MENKSMFSAIKILNTDETTRVRKIRATVRKATGLVQGDEAAVLRALGLGDHQHPGFQHVIHIQEAFSTNGPLGPHECLVLPLMGDTLPTSFTKRQPLSFHKHLSTQLLKGLAYIHGLNITHGDLKADNIMLDLPKTFVHEPYLASASNLPRFEEDVASFVGLQGEREQLQFPKPQAVKFDLETHMPWHIRIADFGLAYSSKPPKTIQPSLLRAPEVRLQLRAPDDKAFGYSPAVDMWGLGCILFEAVTGTSLFYSYPTNQWPEDLFMLTCHEAWLEKYKPAFLARCKRAKFFFNNGKLKRKRGFKEDDIPCRLRTCSTFSPPEQSDFFTFLRQTLRLDPEDRVTAEAALKLPFILETDNYEDNPSTT